MLTLLLTIERYGKRALSEDPRMKRYIQTETGKTTIDLLGWSCWVLPHLPLGYFKNPSNAQFAMV